MSPEVVGRKSPASTPAETLKSGVEFEGLVMLVIVGKTSFNEPFGDSGIAKIRYQGKLEICPEFPLGSRENDVAPTGIVCPPRPTPVVQLACEPGVEQNPTFGSIIWPKAETHTKLATISNARILAYLIVPPRWLIA